MVEKKRRIWFRRLFNYTIILGIVLGGSVLAYETSPPEVIYTNDDFDWSNVPTAFNSTKWNVLMDVHSHTTGSDGILTPEQSILFHIAQGFNAMVVTDHNVWPKDEEIRNIARNKYNDSIKVFIGMEWGTLIHMNLILPPNATDYSHIKGQTTTPNFEEIQTVINATHDLGGIVIVNHVFDGPEINSKYPSRQLLYEWGVDYFESYNGKDYDNISATFSQTHGMSEVAGSDSHGTETIYAWNALNVSIITETNIFDALKNKQTTILYDSNGMPSNATSHPNPAYIPYKPFIAIGSLIESYYTWYMHFDWAGIFLLIGYLYGGFILYYAAGSLKEKFWLKLHKNQSNQ